MWACFFKLYLRIQFGSVDSAGETPSYISNLEVKSCCGDGSARATECENSKMLPLYFKKAPDLFGAFFLLIFLVK